VHLLRIPPIDGTFLVGRQARVDDERYRRNFPLSFRDFSFFFSLGRENGLSLDITCAAFLAVRPGRGKQLKVSSRS